MNQTLKCFNNELNLIEEKLVADKSLKPCLVQTDPSDPSMSDGFDIYEKLENLMADSSLCKQNLELAEQNFSNSEGKRLKLEELNNKIRLLNRRLERENKFYSNHNSKYLIF